MVKANKLNYQASILFAKQWNCGPIPSDIRSKCWTQNINHCSIHTLMYGTTTVGVRHRLVGIGCNTTRGLLLWFQYCARPPWKLHIHVHAVEYPSAKGQPNAPRHNVGKTGANASGKLGNIHGSLNSPALESSNHFVKTSCWGRHGICGNETPKHLKATAHPKWK